MSELIAEAPTTRTRVDQLLQKISSERPLPLPGDGFVDGLLHAIASEVASAKTEEVAVAVAAAGLCDLAFQLHRLSEDADCSREQLLLGDLCMVSAAELLARIDRPDVETAFGTVAMLAAVGAPYQDGLQSAAASVAAAATYPDLAPWSAPDADASTESGLGRMLEARLDSILDQDPELVSAPMRDLVAAGGKRLRPVLVMLCSSIGGQQDLARAATLGCVFELIHAAALVHDDIVDDSPMRRGKPSVQAAYGIPVAVRVGDFYFARASELLAKLASIQTTHIAMDAVVSVCLAQLDEYRNRGLSVDENIYLATVEGKTAALFSGACAAGAAQGGAPASVVKAMGDFGRELGVAFQIQDDVIDFLPTSGKPIAQDLRQSVASLPLIYARRKPQAAAELLSLEGDGDGFREHAGRIVRESGALDEAIELARVYRDRALVHLSVVRDGDVRRRLAAIANRAVERES